MSLQGLISGAECALPNNPLAQVLKHTESDNSVQRDRVAGPSNSTLYRLPSTSAPQAKEKDLAFARQFFGSNAPNGQSSSTSLFAQPQLQRLSAQQILNSMLQEKTLVSPAELQDAWVKMEMKNRSQVRSPVERGSEWSAEFSSINAMNAMNQSVQGGSSNLSSTQQMNQFGGMQQNYQQNSYMPYQPSTSMGMYDMGYGPQSQAQFGFNSGFNSVPDAPFSTYKGKGRLRDEDFDAAFAEVDATIAAPRTEETARITEIDNDAATLLEAAMHNVSIDDAERLDSSVKYGTDFQTVWDHLQSSTLPPPKEDVAKWEAEFNQLMSSQREDLDEFDLGKERENDNWLSEYEDTWNKENTITTPGFDENGAPVLGDYVFETNNKYLAAAPSSSLLERARNLLRSSGSLTEAALMIEASIQQGELGAGGYEAWIFLGETRSMDEREEAAMRALKEGVRRAGEAGANGEGILSLAISYTNESYSKAAHSLLLKWLQSRFPAAVTPSDTLSLQNMPWDSYTHVRDAFLKVARMQHAEGKVDPDVQTGLGVLFYANAEYEKAKDCFESALGVKPKDYLLWNRYGSCLSNGNKPEEALGAYREALNLWPSYTRAIYNVGVACLNIGLYKEASEHFLSALALQDTTTEGEKSEQLWFTLRRTLIAMGREDLADRAKMGASVDMFRTEGFEF